MAPPGSSRGLNAIEGAPGLVRLIVSLTAKPWQDERLIRQRRFALGAIRCIRARADLPWPAASPP